MRAQRNPAQRGACAQSHTERVLKKHFFEGFFVFATLVVVGSAVGFNLAWGSRCASCADTLPHYSLHWFLLAYLVAAVLVWMVLARRVRVSALRACARPSERARAASHLVG
jgi:hypothetical protein